MIPAASGSGLAYCLHVIAFILVVLALTSSFMYAISLFAEGRANEDPEVNQTRLLTDIDRLERECEVGPYSRAARTTRLWTPRNVPASIARYAADNPDIEIIQSEDAFEARDGTGRIVRSVPAMYAPLKLTEEEKW